MTKEYNFDDLAFEVSIPSAVLLNQNIERSAICLYAFIKGLTRSHGYCFASNGYLAQLMKCDERNIKRMLKSLKQEGFIEIHSDKEGIHWQRHIYLGVNLKKCLRRDKNDTPPGQICPPPGTKMTPIYKEDIEKDIYEDNIPKPKGSPPSAKASELYHYFLKLLLNLKPDMRLPNEQKWVKEFDRMIKIDKRTPENILKVMEWAHKDSFWSTTILSPDSLRNNFDKLEIQMLAKGSKPSVEKNKELAQKVVEQLGEKYDIHMYSESILFRGGAAGDIVIRYIDNGFEDQVFNQLNKMGIPVNR